MNLLWHIFILFILIHLSCIVIFAEGWYATGARIIFSLIAIGFWLDDLGKFLDSLPNKKSDNSTKE